MPLPEDYTVYPKRHEGYDHDLFAWSNMHTREPTAWPEGKSVAIWLCVSLEWFPIIPSGPFKAPGHMVMPYPDFRHYTSRDYGNRVGVWRFLEAFEAASVKASFAVNGAIAERYPELVRAILEAGHEIIGHSTDMNGTIDSSLDEQTERELISDSLSQLQAVTGEKPMGWHSIARSQSWNTTRLLKESGLTYCCDWVNDELPYRFTNGLINLPLNHELSDRQIVTVQQKSADSWAESMRDAFDWLVAEAAGKVVTGSPAGGRMLPVHLTPYIMGLPYRIAAVEGLLAELTQRPQAWFARGDEIVQCWSDQQASTDA